MTYSSDIRLAALAFMKKGHSYRETCRVFDISLSSLQRWVKAQSHERRCGYTRRRKIDADVLKHHVKDHPSLYLRERADIFGVSVSAMHYALKRLSIVKKTVPAIENDVLCKDKPISVSSEN